MATDDENGPEFEWHPAKAARNLEHHGVSFEEAATVLTNELTRIEPDIAHSVEESRWIAIGPSEQGRLLLVIFTERGNRIRLISAREPAPKEVRHYEQNPLT